VPFDVQKLERVQLALRRGDIKAAAREAKVYKLMPLAGDDLWSVRVRISRFGDHLVTDIERIKRRSTAASSFFGI